MLETASSTYFNPYAGASFFEFFAILFQRIMGIFSGSQTLVADEIQILVLGGVAASAALVGTFLVLRKMTMLANSISHTILLGIVLGYLMTRDEVMHGHLNIQAMLFAALLTGLATAFLTEFLTKVIRLQEDASTGLVFTTLFALGIILVTLLTRSVHLGAEVVMGNVDGLQREDCTLVFIILALNVFLILMFFKEYTLTTFDPGLAKALGFSTLFFNYLLMVQVSATTVGAFRAVGVLMVLAFITGPVLIARLLTHDLRKLILVAIGVGIAATLVGVALARHILSVYDMPLSTGGIVVCTLLLFYLLIVGKSLISLNPKCFRKSFVIP